MTRLLAVSSVVLSVALSLAAPAVRAQQPSGTQQPAAQHSQVLPSLAPVVDSVKAAVVNVEVLARAGRNPHQDMPDDLYERFFGRRPGQGGRAEEPVRQGAGSGFIIDPKGLVLTNNHVVENAVQIRVNLDDGREFDAEVLGRDPLTDIALIRLKGKPTNLPVVKLGDSDAIRVGDWALAIGNPFQLASSVSLGIVSAKARTIGAGPYDDFIQTDAAINPGNSGGPLFNLRGEVIGINTAIVGGGAGGIGFAVPSNLARALLPQLEKEGVVSRGFLGVNIQPLTAEIATALGVPVQEGAIVLSMSDDSPAKKAGLKADDIIIAMDGEKIASADALTRRVALKRPGTQVTLSFYRGNKKQDAKVTLGTRPDLENLGLVPRNSENGDDAEGQKARIGIAFQDMEARFAAQARLPEGGALITDVTPGSPADRAQLARGMVIVEANRKEIRNANELMKTLKAAKPGSQVLFRVRTPGSEVAGLRVLTMPEK